MKKLLLALFALTLLASFTAPSYSYAADKGMSFKMQGWYRIRGVSHDNGKDFDDDADDKVNQLETLMRPRFTTVAGGVKLWWEPQFKALVVQMQMQQQPLEMLSPTAGRSTSPFRAARFE